MTSSCLYVFLPYFVPLLLLALTSWLTFFLAYFFLACDLKDRPRRIAFFLMNAGGSTGFLDDFFQRFRGAAKLNQPPVVLERPMPFSDHHKNLGSDKAVKRSMFA
jgi:hypothetical protein